MVKVRWLLFNHTFEWFVAWVAVCETVSIAASIDGWSAGALDIFDMYDVLVLIDLVMATKEDAKPWIDDCPPPPETLSSAIYSYRGVMIDKFTHSIAISSLRYDWGKGNKLIHYFPKLLISDVLNGLPHPISSIYQRYGWTCGLVNCYKECRT